MNARVYESIVRFSVGNFSVRVWRAEKELANFNNRDLQQWARDQMGTPSGDARRISDEWILTEILKFPRIAAVEVTDSVGSGCLVYNDWP